MNEKEIDELAKESTEWMLESEYNKLQQNSKEIFSLQEKIFSPEYHFLLSSIGRAMTKEQVKHSFVLTQKVAGILNNQETGAILLCLMYLLAEATRSLNLNLEKL